MKYRKHIISSFCIMQNLFSCWCTQVDNEQHLMRMEMWAMQTITTHVTFISALEWAHCDGGPAMAVVLHVRAHILSMGARYALDLYKHSAFTTLFMYTMQKFSLKSRAGKYERCICFVFLGVCVSCVSHFCFASISDNKVRRSRRCRRRPADISMCVLRLLSCGWKYDHSNSRECLLFATAVWAS